MLSCMSRNPFGCCSKKLRTTSIALRASSGLVPDKAEEDAGVRDLGTETLDGRGGGRISSEGVIVCIRFAPEDRPWTAELRFGSGSASSCIGES